ncbi:hypothetical protein LXL04_005690 [Taraxacum kok-saghyz]
MSAGGKRFWSAELKRAFVFWKTKEVCRGKNVCGREDVQTRNRPVLPSIAAKLDVAGPEIAGINSVRDFLDHRVVLDHRTTYNRTCSASFLLDTSILFSASIMFSISILFNASFILPPISQLSLILRGANDFMLDEMDTGLHDADCIVKRTIQSNTVVAGGGAIEAV